MSNKQFLLISVATFLFLSGLYLGYGLGVKEVNDAANHRAIQMIQNNEIPNHYLEVETVDYLINNKSGKLEKIINAKSDNQQKDRNERN